MVLVYSDNINQEIELLNKAVELSKELGEESIAIMIGKYDEDVGKKLVSYGANKVLVAETELKFFKSEEYTDILRQILEDTKSKVLFVGSNKNGKELASRLAGNMDLGCVIDATNMYLKDGSLTVERVVFSGNAISVQKFNSFPAIVTVPSKVFDPLKKDDSRKGVIEKKTYKFEKSASTISGVTEMESGDVNVEEAEIIVSCGRGFKNKEDIKLANDLADVLKGKTVGCSRPIAADLKWLSEDHWIGLSGHKVKPKLYIAAGISGQIQHIAGMRDSDVVVAINKDPEALIFKSADYGIVGDLYQVLPKLSSAIKEKMG